jgi:flagellar protein FlgJ
MLDKVDSTLLYNDVQGLQQIKGQAEKDPQRALEKVAKQFEAVFLQMVLKSMRQANNAISSELFNSQQQQYYQEMFDNQLAMHLSQSNFGLADHIVRQMQQTGAYQAKVQATESTTTVMPKQTQVAKQSDVQVQQQSESALPNFSSPKQFIEFFSDMAKQAARKLGLDPKVLLAQAALETGWGKKIVGGLEDFSYNLFNIKADKSWQADKVNATTLEHQQGAMQKTQAQFRKYPSFQQSFDDYVRFLNENPRYQQALQNTSDAQVYIKQLQQAGYATDPQYADKILNILKSEVMQAHEL